MTSDAPTPLDDAVADMKDARAALARGELAQAHGYAINAARLFHELGKSQREARAYDLLAQIARQCP